MVPEAESMPIPEWHPRLSLCRFYQVRELRGVEARACLLHAGQVSMAHDLTDGRELALQLLDELRHRLLLGMGAGVGEMAMLVQTSLVADAYRVGIVASGMGAHALQGAGGHHRAVTANVEVIADEAPVVHLYVVMVELGYGVALVAACSGAMHHNHVDLSHVCQNFKWLVIYL